MNIVKLSTITDMAEPNPLPSTELASLDQLMIEALAGNVQAFEESKLSQLSRASSAAHVTDPEQLHAIQVDMANYSVAVSQINAVVRKLVSTVETLVKS